jgi:hypothetical protein
VVELLPVAGKAEERALAVLPVVLMEAEEALVPQVAAVDKVDLQAAVQQAAVDDLVKVLLELVQVYLAVPELVQQARAR